MTTATDDGEVRTELRVRALLIEVDRRAKRNAFTPELFDRLRGAPTRLDEDPGTARGERRLGSPSCWASAAA
jgi:enoyl-CoA hydratase/carnithine racemase